MIIEVLVIDLILGQNPIAIEHKYVLLLVAAMPHRRDGNTLQ